MKRLICEMCDGENLIKENGVFVCQDCGCKYSVEEAKKMMREVDTDTGATAGVKKEKKPETKESSKVDTLLTRVKMFLEDGDWEKTEEYCQKVLDIEPENAQAWLTLLLNNHSCKKIEDLRDCFYDFEDDNEYKKVLRFADEALKAELKAVARLRREDIARKKEEERKKQEELEAQQRAQELARLQRGERLKGRKFPVLAVGRNHTVGLKTDGTVVAVGSNEYGQCNVSGWRNIIAVAAGEYYTVGLKTDGTVVAVGRNEKYCCNVQSWRGIVEISAGMDYTVGLNTDGNLEDVGGRNDFNWFNPSARSGNASVIAAEWDVIGIRPDGTVASTCKRVQEKIKDWKDIIAIATDNMHGESVLGLKADGTVVYSEADCDWENVISIAMGERREAFGLKADGTVLLKNNSCRTQTLEWQDIIAITAGWYHTVGLKADGTVVAVGRDGDGQCSKVSEWKLFDSLDEFIAKQDERDGLKTKIAENLRAERERLRIEREAEEERARIRRAENKIKYRQQGLCQYCGGKFKGLFVKICSNCSIKKDY